MDYEDAGDEDDPDDFWATAYAYVWRHSIRWRMRLREMNYEDAGDEDDPDDFWATAKWLKAAYTSSLRPEDDGDVYWAKSC
jgi:hypothetical protein